MEKVNDIIKNVIDQFFDLDEKDKPVHLSTEDSQLVADAVEASLKSKGVIS
jgi:hypothetical protein